MDAQKALGLAIRQRRTSQKLNQSQLAERAELDQGAISRIERGEQGASLEALERIAVALGTRPGRLQIEADMLRDVASGVAEEATAYQLTQMSGIRHVPLISLVEAGNFADAVDSYARGTGTTMIQTAAKVGRLAYALRVSGHSMTNPRDERRSFPDGTVVIVDPSRSLENGALVIARLDDHTEATFKQYTEDAGVRMLVPLNPQYPTIPIVKPMTYCGTVVAKAEEAFD